MGELITFTGTSGGTATTIVSTALEKFIPQATAQVNFWVHCLSGTGVIGQEVRAKSFAPTTDTLTLHDPGFSAVTPSGATYEIHARTRRARKLEAINSAVRQLGLIVPREVIDTTLTGVADQFTYTLPSNQNWVQVHKVEVHSGASATLVGFPFEAERAYRWNVRREQNRTTGTETWTLQFDGQSQIPTGRVIRVTGVGGFTELAADADVLPLGGAYEGRAIEWIMDWAKYRLLDETVERQPGGEAERYRLRALDMLQKQKEDLLTLMRVPGPGIIETPLTKPHARSGLNLGEFNIYGVASEFS